MKSSFVFFLPFLFFTSCATITRGVHEKLKVVSEPSGAEARLSTGEKGVTPAKFVKRRKESFTVTVSKPGYIPQTVKVESRFSSTGGTAMVGNVIAGGIIGVGVDAMSGATSSLYPNPVSVRLVPQARSSPPKRTAPAQKPLRTKSTPKPASTPVSKPEETPIASPFPPSPSPTPAEQLRDASSTGPP